MFHLFGNNSEAGDALDLLRADHDEIKKLFDEYEEHKDESDDATKEQIVAAICQALSVHAAVEEEMFYPAVREAEEADDMLDEAAVEHQSVKYLVAQLQAAMPSEEFYDAMVKVLSEYVQHHVREEELEIFPKAKSAALDLAALGKKMAGRSAELMQYALAASAKGRSTQSHLATRKKAAGAQRRAAQLTTSKTTHKTTRRTARKSARVR